MTNYHKILSKVLNQLGYIDDWIECGRRNYEGWNNAKDEEMFYHVTGGHTIPDIREECLCTHKIIEQCYIYNKKLDIVEVVGNECINRFGIDTFRNKCVECGIKTNNKRYRYCDSCGEKYKSYGRTTYKFDFIHITNYCGRCGEYMNTKIEYDPLSEEETKNKLIHKIRVGENKNHYCDICSEIKVIDKCKRCDEIITEWTRFSLNKSPYEEYGEYREMRQEIIKDNYCDICGYIDIIQLCKYCNLRINYDSVFDPLPNNANKYKRKKFIKDILCIRCKMEGVKETTFECKSCNKYFNVFTDGELIEECEECNRVYFNVPFDQKDEAKSVFKMKWDPSKKLWFCDMENAHFIRYKGRWKEVKQLT